MKNKNLNSAKEAKNDEFYTRLPDIENELKYYKEQFKGKTVFCNCDDPLESKFWHHFATDFEHLGLKKLIATHYSPNGSSYALILTKYGEAPTKITLKGNGDFRSEECRAFEAEADIVVTNPPFSLFREYIAQLIKHNKQFLIIGSMNAITYKDVFGFIKSEIVWLGHTNPKEFVKPDGSIQKFGNICWYTNLLTRRHTNPNKEGETLPLGRFYKGSEDNYPTYDNYDAIEVSKVSDIPQDYEGIMGVPISFLEQHNINQFKIVGLTSGRDEFEAYPTKRYLNPLQVNADRTLTNGSKANTRATLRLANIPNGIYYTADNAEGPLKIIYARILIKNLKPVKA